MLFAANVSKFNSLDNIFEFQSKLKFGRTGPVNSITALGQLVARHAARFMTQMSELRRISSR